MATTLKKYIFSAVFEDLVFGAKLDSHKVKELQQGLYGHNIQKGQKFKVYQPKKYQESNNQYQSFADFMDLKQGIPEISGIINNIQIQKPTKTIMTNQQVIIQENGKKIIVPQMQKQIEINDNSKKQIVPQMQKNTDSSMIKSVNQVNQDIIQKVHQVIEIEKKNSKKKKQTEVQNEIGDLNKQSSQNQDKFLQDKKVKIEKQVQKVCLKGPDAFQQTMYKLNGQQYLEIDFNKDTQKTKILCYQIKDRQKIHLWTDFIDGQVLIITHNLQYIIYYTSKSKLYINSDVGRRVEVPMMIDKLAHLKLNKNNFMLLLNQYGDFRITNLKNQTNLVKSNVAFIVKQNIQDSFFQSFDQIEYAKDPVENVTLDQQQIPFIFFKNKSVCYFNYKSDCWSKLDAQDYQLEFFNKLQQIENVSNKMIFPEQSDQLETFFQQIIEQQEEGSSEIHKKLISIAFLEERIVFLINHNNVNQFGDLCNQYIHLLCQCNEINKIRQFFNDLFLNQSSQEQLFLKQQQINIEQLYGKLISIVDQYQSMDTLSIELKTFIQY